MKLYFLRHSFACVNS